MILCLLFPLIVHNSCCKAGKDGKAAITIHVFSDSKNPVYGADVYIKYGQSKAPGSINDFDEHVQTGPGTNVVTFSNLQCGTYYLFAKGYDSLLASPLSGGAPISILRKKRNKGLNTNMYIRP